MKKVLTALSVGCAAIVAAYLAYAKALITPDLVLETAVAALYVVLSILSSWLITATVGTRHRAMAMGAAAGMYLAVQGWRWYALDVSFAPWQLFVALIVGVSSPYLYAAFRALLAHWGVVVKVNRDTGVVEAIKVDDDETIWIGAPTVPDMARQSVEKPAIPRHDEGDVSKQSTDAVRTCKPEPSNE